jgi:hypothetical protein
VGVANQSLQEVLQGRSESEEFSFYAEESAQFAGARSAGIPVKNEVTTQIALTFQAKSPLEKPCPPTNLHAVELTRSEADLGF